MQRPMRRWIGTMMLAVALTAPGPALAKKKGKGKNNGIQITGIESFDDVFADVKSMDKRLTSANKLLGNAKKELNTALGLKEGTPLKDGIAELRTRADGKIGLGMKGKIPTLEATDAVPTDVQTGIDAVNQLNSDLVTSIEDLLQVSKDIQSVVKKSKAFPSQVSKEFDGGLLEKIFKMPKAAKATVHNLGITKELPGKTKKVLTRMQDIEKTVRGEFKPLLPGKDKKGGDARSPLGGKDGGMGWSPDGPGKDKKPGLGKPGGGNGNGGGNGKGKKGIGK